MKCSYCGNEPGAGASFCTNCGAKLGLLENPPQAPQKAGTPLVGASQAHGNPDAPQGAPPPFPSYPFLSQYPCGFPPPPPLYDAEGRPIPATPPAGQNPTPYAPPQYPYGYPPSSHPYSPFEPEPPYCSPPPPCEPAQGVSATGQIVFAIINIILGIFGVSLYFGFLSLFLGVIALIQAASVPKQPRGK